MDLSEWFNTPEFQGLIRHHAEEMLKANPFIRALKEAKNRTAVIPFPVLPEFSKEPLDAEIIVEDILDAEIIG